jgi:hypothetical protein
MWFFAFIAIVLAEAAIVAATTNDKSDDSGLCAGG